MIDIEATVRARLVANVALAALTGPRIYASVTLPAGYQPSLGPAVIFNVNGGSPDYAPVLRPTLMFRSYGLTEAIARQTDRAVFDALHDYRGGAVMSVRNDVLGQLLAESDTQWRFVLSYYKAMLLNS